MMHFKEKQRILSNVSTPVACFTLLLDRGIDRIPGVQLVLGGNPKSISKIYAALKQEPSMPVVIFKGTGEAADLLAYAVRFDI